MMNRLLHPTHQKKIANIVQLVETQKMHRKHVIGKNVEKLLITWVKQKYQKQSLETMDLKLKAYNLLPLWQ